MVGVAFVATMKRSTSSTEVVHPRELTLREIECELEMALELYKDDPSASELTAALREVVTYKSEKGVDPWQSVAAFAQRHPDDWQRICADERMQWLAKSFDNRYGALFRLSTGEPRESVDGFDARLHAQVYEVASGIHEFFSHSDNALDIQEALSVVQTSTVAQVFESGDGSFYLPPKMVGLALGASVPELDATGRIIEDQRRNLGPVVLAGPGYRELLRQDELAN